MNTLKISIEFAWLRIWEKWSLIRVYYIDAQLRKFHLFTIMVLHLGMILKCITLLSTLNLIKTLRFETEFIKENIEQGKKKYQEYKEASRSEKTGSCWGSAILVSVFKSN